MNAPIKVSLKAKDFATDQEVRWCPGCGDYAILKNMQKTLARLGVDPDQTVFVSGIGCAARFPYYMATYGFHTIHGRAAAIATGVKIANPELDVWVISGDGDSLSIGGNHLLHLLRRNVDVQYLLFNNEIYGLTKGQYSPTSRLQTHSPSSPQGSVDAPVHPASFAFGAGARFVARATDTGQAVLADVLEQAHAHRGTSFVEILQNCIVYNDAIFEKLTDKKTAADHLIELKHGEPLVYGANKDKGIRLLAPQLTLEVVDLNDDSVSESDLLTHDQTNPVLARLLAEMNGPDMPVAVGVIYNDPTDSFEQRHGASVKEQPQATQTADLAELFASGQTWAVKAQ